jgi:hypothetical protein
MIKLPAYLTGFRSRSDKSIGLTFETQELPGDTLAELQSLNQSYGWLLFKANETDDLEAPDEDAPTDENEVSPSKRLYNRMFVYFKEKKLPGDFTDWRRKELERLGQKYLNAIR